MATRGAIPNPASTSSMSIIQDNNERILQSVKVDSYLPKTDKELLKPKSNNSFSDKEMDVKVLMANIIKDDSPNQKQPPIFINSYQPKTYCDCYPNYSPVYYQDEN